MSNSPRLRSRLFGGLLFTLALGTLIGCGGKGSGGNNTVSGKVTLNGNPVAGQVVFIASDNKEYTSPIGTDGNYQLINPPKGEGQILIKPMGGTPPMMKGAGVKGPEMPGTGGMKGAGTPAPPKYGTPAGGLKLNVTGGDQKHDIPLTP